MYDKNGKHVATVSEEYIYDHRGEKIASFDGYEKVGKKKQKVYKTEKGKKFTYSKGKLFHEGSTFGFLVKKIRPFPFLTSLIMAVFASSIPVVSINHIYISENFVPTISIYDVNGDWGDYGTVAVFDGLIYPSKAGSYTFFIKNSNKFEIEYSFSLDHFYNGKAISSFPLLYKLKLKYTYLTEDWVNATELVFDSVVINSNVKQEFVLEWYWPFENSSDNNIDTWFGADNGKYFLNINLSAQVYER